MSVYWCAWDAGEGKDNSNYPSLFIPHMPTFDIPTGPTITERSSAYNVPREEVCHTMTLKMGMLRMHIVISTYIGILSIAVTTLQ